MQALETAEDLRRAEAAAAEIFSSFGVRTSQPFRETIEARLLLYPIDYTMLEPGQFGALAAAAAAVGDSSAYLAAYGSSQAGWEATYDHRLVALDDFLDYKPKGQLILEHLLYSPQGAWGVVTSHGDYAVAGGPQRFVDTLRRHLPQAEEEAVKIFVTNWREIGRGGGDVDWLRPLIEHVYGEHRAATVWSDG